jgi:hypothetical protein
MEPKNFKFGGGAGATLLHPVVLVALLIVAALLLFSRRKYAFVPLLLIVFLTPLSQQIVIAGFHVFVLRILILTGWGRMLWSKFSSQKKLLAGGWTSIDTAFVGWAIARALAFILLYQAGGAVIYQIGFLWDALGGYFLLRFLIQDDEDVTRTIKTFAAAATILAVTMLGEKLLYRNIFGYLGGVSIFPEIRDGAIRAQGPFGHSILAGVFGAVLFPLFLWLWKGDKSRFLGVISMMAAVIIVFCTGSSTPLLGFAGGILAIGFWPIRSKMRIIRWGIVIALITLHLIMKAPVWFIITHIDLIGASSGYHRAELIDQCIRHFWDWWLVGTKDNASWGWDMYDLSDQYVAEAVAGGLATLVFFIALISRGFGKLGDVRKIVAGDPQKEWLVWLLGSSLLAHCIGFFGVSYWDQMEVVWFALFAMIGAATSALVARPVAELEAVPARFPMRYQPPTPVPVAKPWLQPSRMESARPLKWLDETVVGQRKP